MFEQGPSEHLSWAELACRDGTPYPLEWRVDRARPLALEFEQIRAAVGAPIGINSAYRHLAYNRRVPSKDTSQHVEGRALDLDFPPGWTLRVFLEIVLKVAQRPGSRLRGIGVYPAFIHIDARPTTRLARWRGTRVAESLRTA